MIANLKDKVKASAHSILCIIRAADACKSSTFFPSESTAFEIMRDTLSLGKFHSKRLKQIISNHKVVLQISVTFTKPTDDFPSCFIFRRQENNVFIVTWLKKNINCKSSFQS